MVTDSEKSATTGKSRKVLHSTWQNRLFFNQLSGLDHLELAQHIDLETGAVTCKTDWREKAALYEEEIRQNRLTKDEGEEESGGGAKGGAKPKTTAGATATDAMDLDEEE